MFGFFRAVLFSGLGWLVRGVVVRFVTFWAIFFACQAALVYLIPLLPGVGVFDDLVDVIPSGTFYFLNMIAFPQGVSLVISAMGVRFFIRRLPMVG